MIASLPMYWRAETAALWRAFWAEVQRAAYDQGVDLPDLTAPEDIPHPWTDHWLRDDLALSMTCGLPFRTALKNRVTYVGTLDFALGSPPGHYYSNVIRNVPRSDETAPHGLRLAYNSADSQSGWAVTQHADPFSAAPTFGMFLETGGHAASLAAVADGRADIAYLDAVTWRLLQRHDPNAARVHDHGRSVITPGLPLITARGTDPAPLRQALLDASRAFAPADPMTMGGPISLQLLDPQAYFAIPIPNPPST